MIDVKEYLGDGAYVNFDGYHIILTAENGIYVIDRVALDPEVLERFFQYAERIKKYKDSFLPSGRELLEDSTEPR